MRVTLTTHSEEETIALGRAIGRVLVGGDVVALHGELGAGKTRLVRGIAEGVGADTSRVSSPTFVIMQEYPCRGGGSLQTLVHMDAYRLQGGDELETVGWDRIASDLEERQPVAAVIEWASRIDSMLPRERRLDVFLEHAGLGGGESGGERHVVIEGGDQWQERPEWVNVARLATPERQPVRCPITGKLVPADSPTYPFFDERARMADLERWMSGSYRVSRQILPDDDMDPGLSDINGGKGGQ